MQFIFKFSEKIGVNNDSDKFYKSHVFIFVFPWLTTRYGVLGSPYRRSWYSSHGERKWKWGHHNLFMMSSIHVFHCHQFPCFCHQFQCFSTCDIISFCVILCNLNWHLCLFIKKENSRNIFFMMWCHQLFCCTGCDVINFCVVYCMMSSIFVHSQNRITLIIYLSSHFTLFVLQQNAFIGDIVKCEYFGHILLSGFQCYERLSFV